MEECKRSFAQRYGLIAGFIALVAVLLMPHPEGLPIAGHYMLALLLFSVIIWMTESVTYPVSAAIILALMTFLLGLAPSVADPKTILGTSKALAVSLSGFNNSALGLVGGALFIAAAMVCTGLDKRIALLILSKIGAKTNRILFGVIVVGFVLSFFVPSTTARVSCLVPIVMGVIVALNVDKKSKFAGVLMIATAQADSIWNVGIKTAAAQNMVALGFIEKMLGKTVTWGEWFIAAAPFAAIMSIVLYYVLMWVMPPETKEIENGEQIIAKQLADLGPMRPVEKRLLAISLSLLFFWTTEQVLHPFDTTSTTFVAIAIMLTPVIGVMNWRDAQSRMPWGTLLLFGVGISLGTALLTTKAATWLANVIVGMVGIQAMPALAILAVLAAFLIIIHMGFASATALASAMIPIVIAVLQSVTTPGISVWGMTMILQYVVSFGFILPVNAPQNMVAYSTETFEVRDFIKTGIPLTIAAYLVILLLGATYWRWLGYV
jgi:anion transporter